jgi:hypothetical protein
MKEVIVNQWTTKSRKLLLMCSSENKNKKTNAGAKTCRPK